MQYIGQINIVICLTYDLALGLVAVRKEEENGWVKKMSSGCGMTLDLLSSDLKQEEKTGF